MKVTMKFMCALLFIYSMSKEASCQTSHCGTAIECYEKSLQNLQQARTEIIGSLPCLRSAHRIDSKGLRSGIDLRRIPHKMLEPLASHKEEPDAWILSVSKPGLNYQNSG